MEKENTDISLLYVEDDPTLRESFSDFFKRRVSTFYSAKDGQEGLEIFLKSSPDIVVTDIRMPRMDGVEMIKEIRKADTSVPIIVTSAFSEQEYLLQAINLGVTRYLLKPLQRIQLKQMISETLEFVRLKKTEKVYLQQLEEKNEALEKALSEIKMLQGIIPICSVCKSIRTDEQAWESLESYIHTHSDAELSHGLCPNCSDDLYGKHEWYQKMKAKKKDQD